MAQTVVGLFDDRDEAQRVVKDFLAQKFPSDRISIIATDSRGEFSRQTINDKGENKAGEGAITGMLSGAIVGGVFGLLVGVGVLAIPGVGLLVAGPAAIALAGAGIGAVGGGLLGTLIGLGIPKEQVQTYAEAIRRGGCLVAVESDEADVVRANDIMRKHKAVDIHQRASYYANEGFSQYDAKAPVYSEAEAAAERVRIAQLTSPSGSPTPSVDEAALRSRYQSSDAQGIAYEQWEPAYRFGWQLAQDPSYQNFASSEPVIQQQWESTNAGTYSTYREAIFAGFDDAFARRSGPKML